MLPHVTRLITPKHEHRWLALILISLHGVLWWDLTTWLAQLLLLGHFACFLLWQPFWRQHNLPNLIHLSVFGLGVGSMVLLFNPWLITLWQIILLGLLGGRDLVKPLDRFVNMSAVTFLTLDLLIINIHQLFVVDTSMWLYWRSLDAYNLLQYSLLIIPLSFLLINTDDSYEHRHHVDFFHGLTLALLVILIATGSLVIMYHTQVSYPLAVFEMTLGMALFILTISWLWVVLAGEQGLDYVWTHHLLNVGNSFERWLDELAQPSNYKELTAQQFLTTGFEQLARLPWVTGLSWQSLYGAGQLGGTSKHHLNIAVQSIEVTVYAHYRISGSHYFHVKILVQLLEYFHQAKRREEAFAQQAHLQAIHETGAKLTHDIKNLLQSLHAISSVIETCQPAQFGDTQRLLQGQMPHLTQRLKRTLDKLQKPTEFSYSDVPISLWWGNLLARYRKQHIEFKGVLGEYDPLIPEDLFDNVAENLLQNVLMKRKREPDLQILVTLQIDAQQIALLVCDNGSPIPEDIVQNLLSQPVSSRDGFGIGLYQAAKQLGNTGYELNLKENVAGQVCFELVGKD